MGTLMDNDSYDGMVFRIFTCLWFLRPDMSDWQGFDLCGTRATPGYTGIILLDWVLFLITFWRSTLHPMGCEQCKVGQINPTVFIKIH